MRRRKPGLPMFDMLIIATAFSSCLMTYPTEPVAQVQQIDFTISRAEWTNIVEQGQPDANGVLSVPLGVDYSDGVYMARAEWDHTLLIQFWVDGGALLQYKFVLQ